jgi:hypothetical protein
LAANNSGEANEEMIIALAMLLWFIFVNIDSWPFRLLWILVIMFFLDLYYRYSFGWLSHLGSWR